MGKEDVVSRRGALRQGAAFVGFLAGLSVRGAIAEPVSQQIDPRDARNAKALKEAKYNGEVRFLQPRIIGIWQADDVMFANIDLGNGTRVPIVAADCLLKVLGDNAGDPIEITGDKALAVQRYWSVDLRVSELSGRRLGVPGVRKSDFIAPAKVINDEDSEACKVGWFALTRTIASGATRLAVTNTGRTVESLIEAAKQLKDKQK